VTTFNRSPARRRFLLIVALALVPSVIVAGTAWAAATDNMFPTGRTVLSCLLNGAGQPCQTDNKDVSFYMDSAGTNMLEAVDRAAVNAAIDGEYRPTDLAFAYDSTPVFSGAGETDIVYEESAIGVSDSADGWTFCNAKGGDGVDCDQQYIRIRGGGHYGYGLVCHETGHAVGLQHGDWSSPQLSKTDSRLGCMKTPVYNDDTLGANNRENINATY
jgi:hypothetical protein